MSMQEDAERFLRRLRSEPGYGTEHQRWRDVSNVLWFYGAGGTARRASVAVPPSGFKDMLIKAMDAADAENMAQFALGFSDVALAMWTCKNVPGGTQALADALAEAERIDTPAARRILGAPFLDGVDRPPTPVELSQEGYDAAMKDRGFAVHTPHHGKTDKACHPENGDRRVHIGNGEYVIVGAPLEGPIPAGIYVIKGHGRVHIEESSLPHIRNPVVVPDNEPDDSPIPWRNADGSL
jgi:hypothetical protein